MLIQLLFVMLAAVNIAAYFLMWKDKVRAVRHGWRISENTFFLLSLLGGFIGVYCGMKRFRHKTKHFSFKFVVILSAFIWLVLMPYWYSFLNNIEYRMTSVIKKLENISRLLACS